MSTVQGALVLQPGEMDAAVPTSPGVTFRVIAHRSAARIAKWTIRLDVGVLREAERALGERLRDACLEDVAGILDERDELVRAAIVEFHRAGSSTMARMLSTFMSASPFPDSSQLGPFADARLKAGWEYLHAASTHQAGAATGSPRSAEQVAQADQHQLETIYDPRTPVCVAEALLSARRLPTALLALGYALGDPDALSRAVITEVAEQFATAAKDALRVQLLLKPREVDERLLHREELLTLDDMVEAMKHNSAKLDSVAISEE